MANMHGHPASVVCAYRIMYTEITAQYRSIISHNVGGHIISRLGSHHELVHFLLAFVLYWELVRLTWTMLQWITSPTLSAKTLAYQTLSQALTKYYKGKFNSCEVCFAMLCSSCVEPLNFNTVFLLINCIGSCSGSPLSGLFPSRMSFAYDGLGSCAWLIFRVHLSKCTNFANY